MKLVAENMTYNFKNADVVAVFLHEDYQQDIDDQIIPDLAFIKERGDLTPFKGKKSETMFIPFKNLPSIILAGLGRKTGINRESLRESAGLVIKECKKRNISSIHVVLPVLNDQDELSIVSSIAEGLCLTDYNFDKYKSVKEDEDSAAIKEIKKIYIYNDKIENIAKVLKETEVICSNVLLCRDLINESSEVSNPVGIARKARALSKLKGVTCRVFGKKDIEKMKMGLLLAVSRGSTLPPQFVVLNYNGNPRSKKRIAIVGKGITYDSGGMNLKPSSSIEDMRTDMAGAAACLYTVKAAAELRLKKNITALIPLCENMISNNSFRSGDVFTSYSGRNVEIGNTDAEGRLILADAVAYAEKNIKPDYIVDIATLTGACLICFGESIAALLSNKDSLAEAIFKSGETTGEKVWRLPFDKDYDEMLKSDYADIKNVGPGRQAGTIVGGTFIKKFIKEVPWAHIDIAGTAWHTKAKGYLPKYASGFGVRLFIDLIKTIDI